MRSLKEQIGAVDRARTKAANDGKSNPSSRYDADTLADVIATLRWCEHNKPLIERIIAERKP